MPEIAPTSNQQTNKMQETRQNRIARLLQKELSLIFQSQTRMMRGVMVSVRVPSTMDKA